MSLVWKVCVTCTRNQDGHYVWLISLKSYTHGATTYLIKYVVCFFAFCCCYYFLLKIIFIFVVVVIVVFLILFVVVVGGFCCCCCCFVLWVCLIVCLFCFGFMNLIFVKG